MIISNGCKDFLNVKDHSLFMLYVFVVFMKLSLIIYLKQIK